MGPKTQGKGKGVKENIPVAGGAGTKKGGTIAPEQTANRTKADKKAMRKAIEETRLRERDEMMQMKGYSDHSDEEEEEEEDNEIESGLTMDKFGNTISKAKAAEDAKLEELRAAARTRRAEKEAAAAAAKAEESAGKATGKASGKGGGSAVGTIEDIREKLQQGLKLSHKEKKLLKLHESSAAEEQQMLQEHEAGLSSFSLSVQQQGSKGGGLAEEGAEASAVSATDIIVSSFSISAPSRALLVDASLKLSSGRRYGLLGPNGRGKTTLLKYLAARKIPIPPGVDVLLVEQEVLASEESVVSQVLAADVRRSSLLAEEGALMEAFTCQDMLLNNHEEIQEGEEEEEEEEEEEAGVDGNSTVTASTSRRAAGPTSGKRWSEEEWKHNLERFVTLGAELEASGADACEAKVRKILTGLGFDEDAQNGSSVKLSGGWRMRVSLARALFMEPKLLLLDEPTNHLDLNAVIWLDDYFANHWKGTLLIVSHDADFLDSVCTDIIHLDDCKLNQYSGSFTDFAGMRGQIEAKKEKDFKLQEKTLKEFKSSGLAVEKAEKKTLQKLGYSTLIEKPREYRVNFHMKSPEEHGPSIDLLDVSFAYPGAAAPIFTEVRLRVNTHSRVAIVGPNGVGKSTLLKLMTGALDPTHGEILRHNKLRLGIYHQHFEDLLPMEVTPIEFLVSEYGIPILEARKYLGMFGLDGARHTIRIGQLSGGQKARVVLASLSLRRPHILILDEPTNHLDIESVEALIDSLKVFPGGVVLVSHDARLISATECELWVCGREGRGGGSSSTGSSTGSVSGLRVENRGFDKYRRDVIQEAARAQALAERKAQERLQLRRAQREQRKLRINASTPAKLAAAAAITGSIEEEEVDEDNSNNRNSKNRGADLASNERFQHIFRKVNNKK